MSDADGSRPVRLDGVPVGLARAATVHRNDMIRELQLIEVGRRQGIEEPSQLYDLAELLRADLEWLRDEIGARSIWSDPDAAPGSLVDIVIETAPDSALRMRRVVERFEELNQLSRHGQLLAEEASADAMQLIRWVADEMTGQLLEGRHAHPCPVGANVKATGRT